MEINLVAENFEREVLKSDLPVLVDFWAPWCGPCRMITPQIEALAREYDTQLKVCKLNVDESPEIATRYAVMSIPAVMLFKQGQLLEKRVGVMSKKNLENLIQPHL